MARFPNNLKRAIDDAGVKRKALAEKVGVSRVTLHKWEHGEARVGDQWQPKIVEALRLPPDAVADLFPQKKEEMLDAA